jgi:hypothetical protein
VRHGASVPEHHASRARPPAFSVAACSRADHMETSERAIRDVAHVLHIVASCCLPGGSPHSALRLWDPFYCQGTVKVHYRQHGFPLCHNRREDFYAVWKAGAQPPHDMLVTNPPFSGDHIQRALQFCAEEIQTPWAMLLPTTVLLRSWWSAMALCLERRCGSSRVRCPYQRPICLREAQAEWWWQQDWFFYILCLLQQH